MLTKARQTRLTNRAQVVLDKLAQYCDEAQALNPTVPAPYHYEQGFIKLKVAYEHEGEPFEDDFALSIFKDGTIVISPECFTHSDDWLAYTIGHEIGHYLVGSLDWLGTWKIPSSIKRCEVETQADAVGSTMAALAGYDVTEVLKTYEELIAIEQSQEFQHYLRISGQTHPPAKERRDRIANIVESIKGVS